MADKSLFPRLITNYGYVDAYGQHVYAVFFCQVWMWTRIFVLIVCLLLLLLLYYLYIYIPNDFNKYK